jgi:hypothetical protein
LLALRLDDLFYFGRRTLGLEPVFRVFFRHVNERNAPTPASRC